MTRAAKESFIYTIMFLVNTEFGYSIDYSDHTKRLEHVTTLVIQEQYITLIILLLLHVLSASH